MANQARQLFVVGAARTGTTALCRYLSMHPKMCILNERYKKMAPDVGPEHFRFSRIRENVEEETNQPADEFEALLSSKRERRLKWIGDKGYGYALAPEHVNDNNPGCVFLMTLREPLSVAASYLDRKHNPGPKDTWMKDKDAVEHAVRHYNAVLIKARKFIRQRPAVPFIVVEYESFFLNPESYEPLLSGTLGMDLKKLVKSWQRENESFAGVRKEKPISEEDTERVNSEIDRVALDWIKAYAIGQRTAAEIVR